MTEHHELPLGEIHKIANWQYADAATRAAATGFVTADLLKVAHQQDDNSLWILVATVPTWVQVGAGDVTGPGSSTDNAIARFDGAGGDTLQDSAVTVSDIGVIESILEDAVTNAVTQILKLAHNSSGTPAAGLGAGIELQAETSTTASQTLAQLVADWATVTHASRKAQFRMLLNYAGTMREVAVIKMPPYAGTAIGNARGDGAYDFQAYRNAADRVASEEYSSIWGGSSNKNAGVNASIVGGDYNEVTSNGWTAIVLGGTGGLARLRSQIVSGHLFAANGDAQGTIQLVAKLQQAHGTTNWYELFLDGSSERMTIPTDTAWVFDILLVGATSGMAKTFGFRIEGVIENDGGTTTLLASTVTTLYDTDDVSFDARVRGDDTNDALVIEVSDSDAGGDTVRWVATIRTSEVTYA